MKDLEELLPSLGYFGAGNIFSLKVPVNKKITGVRLCISDPIHRFLNLRSLSAKSDGVTIDLLALGGHCQQSSFHSSDIVQDASSLIKTQGIHTNKETEPWWEIRFNHLIYISELYVENRPDGYGCRSRTLKVSICQNDDEWQTLHDSCSANQALDAIENVAKLCKAVTFIENIPRHALRTAIVKNVSDLLLSSGFEIQNVNWKVLIQFVPLWVQSTFSKADFLLIAGMALSGSLKHDYMVMLGFSLCLKSPQDIINFQSAINEIAAAHSLGSWVVTRHGVQQARLLTHKTSYLNAITDVMNALNELNMSPVLAYGSLLGAVRGNGFIAHDDDVDLLYLVDAVDQKSAEMKVKLLGEELSQLGFKVAYLAPHGLNMHIQTADSDAIIDIFPCWIVNGKLYLHMEKMRIRDIDPNIIYPKSSTLLYDHNFSAPALPKAFLTERYGQNWNTPDPYFEWPWSLVE